MLSSPGWRGSTWTTGPNGIRTSPPASAITGSTRYLADPSAPALEAERRALDGFAGRLAAVDRGALSAEHRVDAAMMADSLARRVFELDELREHTWNPLQANPGKAIYQLLARDFAPLPDRLASVASRLAAIPGVLAEARRQLGRMPGSTWRPRSGSSTARSRWSARRSTPPLRARPLCAAELARVRPAALEALTEHRAWLSAQLDGPDGFADPRIGPERFARKLSLTLSAAADADTILARAQADLDRMSEQIAELAAEMAGRGQDRPRNGAEGARPAGRGRAGRHHDPGVLP